MIALCSVVLFVQWKHKQNELKRRILERLSNRGEKLLHAFSMLTERYFLRETKLFLIEYLLSVIQRLKQAGMHTEFTYQQYNLTRLYAEISSSKYVAEKRRVSSQVEFDQTQGALQYILKELRNLLELNYTSRVMIRHHIGLMRFTHSLAYRDLLVFQAKQDLEHERRSRAIEKYRLALAVMDKHSTIDLARKESSRLQNMILDVEEELLVKTKSENSD